MLRGRLLKILAKSFGTFSTKRNINIAEVEKNVKNRYYPKNPFELIDKNFNYEESLDLSIVIPVYNSEQYLKRCLDSCISQTTIYNYEIICIDDKSTDRSNDILKTYQENNKNIVLLENKENHGISYSRNIGIQNSKGKYILFMDNDDKLEEYAIEKLIKIANAENADIVRSSFCINFEDSKKTDYLYKDKITIFENNNNECLGLSGYVWGSLIKRTLFSKIRFPIDYWYEDMIMAVILYRICKKCVYIPSVLYQKYEYKTSASRTLWDKKSIKSYEQYFLLYYLDDYALNSNLKHTKSVCDTYLFELGRMLFSRTIGLKSSDRKNIFLISCSFINTIIEETKFETNSWDKKLLMKSFANYDYYLWNLAVIAQYYSK